MNLLEKVEISKLIIEYSLKKYSKIFAACSFGKDSMVLVDLCKTINGDIEFIGIDTGYEFSETLDFADKAVKLFNMNFRWIKPTDEDVERVKNEYGNSMIKDDQYICCEMKVAAANRIMNNYEAWMTGLRRDETEYRKNIKIIEPGKTDKINPLAFWTHEDIWKYLGDNKIIHHPLYDAGFTSLGCKPCTSHGSIRSGGGRQGQFERAGRFVGTNHSGQECGLHKSR